ncbi:MAG: HdeD family acid-resistance protein [Lysobacterales bacterium]
MTGTVNTMGENIHGVITDEVREHRNWFLVMGAVMVLLGLAAIVFPFIATLAVELSIGWILLISGAAGIAQAIRAARWKGFLFSLLSALLSLGIGVILLLYPLTGILSLTVLLATFFIIVGIFRILQAMSLRPHDHWGWLLTSGILALVLAALIIIQWPEAVAWVIGLLVGIDLIFNGWTLVMLANAARRGQ